MEKSNFGYIVTIIVLLVIMMYMYFNMTILIDNQEELVCGQGYHKECVKTGYPFISCGVGETAECMSKGIPYIYNGEYLSKCRFGDVPVCTT